MMKIYLQVFVFWVLCSFASVGQNTIELQKCYANQEFQKVIRLADSLLLLQPKSYETWYYKGQSEQALSKFNQAILSYHKAQESDSNQLQVLYALGICYENAGDDDAALLSYDKLLKADSTYFPAQIRMAAIYKNQRDYQKAIEKYALLINSDSTNGFFYAQLAYCCSKFGFAEPVIPYYLKAVELNPSDLRSISELINELVETKQFEDARYYCDSFLTIFPNNLKLLKQQAFISAMEENSLDAVRQFAYIVSLGDSSQFTCKNYGQSLFNNGQYAESVFWLDLYLKNQPDDTKNHFIMGLACQKDYQFEKSLFHLDRALTLLFDRSLIARIYEENGNTYSKYADYCGFRDSTKSMADSLYNIALESYLEAESINPEGIGIYRTLGGFYLEKKKDPNKALACYEKYQHKLESQKPDSWEMLWIESQIRKIKEDIHFKKN